MDIKQTLAACKTQQDLWNVLDNMDIPDLRELHTALTNAQKFVELTMRNEYILSFATKLLNKIDGAIQDPV